MTVKKQTKCSGLAAIISRQRLHNANQQIDPAALTKPSVFSYNMSVCFNEKDQLQLTNKDEAKDAKNVDKKVDAIRIDDITNCVNVENYPNCVNTLIFYVTRNTTQEAIALKFENEQDFKRIYFTYKYFKMRNRLTKHSNYTSNENLFSKKKIYNDTLKIRKSSIDSYDSTPKTEFDLCQTTDNNGVTHISVEQKNSRFDQPMSLIGIRTSDDLGEIDSVIYTDDIPVKPDRKRILFQNHKPKAPAPPSYKENQKILKGQFVRVSVEKSPEVTLKEIKVSKTPDIAFKDKTKSKTKNNNNLWANASKGATDYESDREEWRSRSQFSTSAFDSLSRPTKTALAFTLRKPARPEIQPPTYYRFGDPKIFPRPNNFLPRPPRIPRPMDIKRNQLNNDHRKFTSLQNLEVPRDVKKPDKKLNISTRITGLTNKLKDLGTNNTLGRFKAQSQVDVANLKPVIKKSFGDGGKRAVLRTCSVEPPKKVTFSAFATVQVV